MLLYIYMIVITILSYILVGIFYGAFSMFIREVLPSDNCMNIFKAANVIENFYLIFLFSCLLLSTTVDVKWAEMGFRACSFGMGLFTILMIISTIIFTVDEPIGSLAVLLISLFLLSYALPLVLNLTKLKF
jgi:hypothetical protein